MFKITVTDALTIHHWLVSKKWSKDTDHPFYYTSAAKEHGTRLHAPNMIDAMILQMGLDINP